MESFDVFNNFELLHKYYQKIVANYTQSLEGLMKDFLAEVANDGTWNEYAIFKNNEIIARAAVWCVNNNACEVAAVSTDPKHQRKGYATKLVSFCTRQILHEGKTAVCTTKTDNTAMIKTLEKVGYVPKGI